MVREYNPTYRLEVINVEGKEKKNELPSVSKASNL